MNEVEQLKRIKQLQDILRSYRDSSLVLSNDKINNGFKEHVTIHKEDCLLDLLELFPAEKDETDPKKGYTKIYGNSFGPFRPKQYFEEDLRIVALLKEDYIEADSADSFITSSDKGGRDKTIDFRSKEDIQAYATYQNLARIVSSIVKALNNDEPGEDDEESLMKHTSVINVNPFPGLSINGVRKSAEVDNVRYEKNYLRQWAELSKIKIQALIDILNPNVVFSGGVLRFFLTNNNLFSEVQDNTNCNNFGQVFDRTIKNVYFVDDAYPNFCIYIDSKGTIWIDDVHPSYKLLSVEPHTARLSNKLKKIIQSYHILS